MGDYQLIGRLGSGGMGTVYAAVSPNRGRVALKVAHPDHAVAEDFDREIAMMRRVEGICGVGVHDVGVVEGRPWAAIEYVAGLSLNRHVRENGPFEGSALLTLAAGCAEAMAAIHAAGVAHGDIKPGNVLVAPGGPKVVDYGIARLLADPQPGSIAGSPGWLAPERYRGGAPDAGSDVFAWACLVVFAATGEPPFGRIPGSGARSRAALAEMARRADRDTVDLDGLPEELRPVLRRALSADPSVRPTADEVYLECLVLLGEERAAAPATWADRLRALLARYWPEVDLSWDSAQRWVTAAATLSASGSAAPHIGEPVAPAPGDGGAVDSGVAGGAAGSGAAGGTAGSGVAGGTSATGAGTATASATGATTGSVSAGSGVGSTASGGLSAVGTAGTETLVPVSFLKMSALVVVACVLTGIIAGGGAQFVQSLANPVPEQAAAADSETDPLEPDFPYTREGTVFLNTGQSGSETFTVTGIERTDEYTVLHYERVEAERLDATFPPLRGDRKSVV